MMFHKGSVSPDPFNLERFVTAQNPVLGDVLGELAQGRKESHWMWFVFPQLKGLGSSWAANHFGIASSEEAKAYLEHPVLGQRLIDCTALVNGIEGSSIQEIFGGIDALKFKSSMTLFAENAGGSDVFTKALEKYFDGRPDEVTLERLGSRPRAAGTPGA